MPQLSAKLHPLLLRPDNFTAPARTPWGGRRIVGLYKATLGLPAQLAAQPIGEAWELSFGPELPSRTCATDATDAADNDAFLYQLVARDPQGYLGAEAVRGSALLVKWLDAADDLSVQIHPRVDDPELPAGETGKPECWYIVARDPGAGIYIGLQPGVNATRMRDAIERAQDVSKLLRFREVQPGDFYLLQPGLPHAVGRGVTLIEPQYVEPGKKGLTLRYWDWNRRYDAAGRPDPNGQGRELHVARALAVTDWALTSDPDWLAQQRTALGEPRLSEAASCSVLCGPEPAAAVRSPYLRAARIAGTGQLTLPSWNTLRALSVIEGAVVLHGDFASVRVERGCSAALPAGLGAVACELFSAHALVSSTVA
jgi:mannose-6-phosphate isomerase class I